MASFRRIALALTIIAAAGCAGLTNAAAQSAFRCPTPETYGEYMKQLVAAGERSRALAEENPLLLADVGYYDAEIKLARRCAPTVASVSKTYR